MKMINGIKIALMRVLILSCLFLSSIAKRLLASKELFYYRKAIHTIHVKEKRLSKLVTLHSMISSKVNCEGFTFNLLCITLYHNSHIDDNVLFLAHRLLFDS